MIPLIVRTGRRPVIFVRDAGIGDIVCTMTAARELKARHPDASFIYNCQRDFMAIPRLFGIANQVTSSPVIGLVGHWYRFLTAGYYQFSHGDPMVVRTLVKGYCDQFNLAAPDIHPHLKLPKPLTERAKKILADKNLDAGSLITIHAGPTLPVKECPRELWVKLVGLLREQGFTHVAQLGVGQYYQFGKVAVEPIPGAVSFLDALTLEESMAVISLARLHIGIDSGLLHVAAAVGTPGIGIFGCTLPEFLYSENYRRSFVVGQIECRGCGHWNAATPYTTTCPNNIRCMKEISPEMVLDACLKKLGK